MSQRTVWFREGNEVKPITIHKTDVLKRIDLLLHIIVEGLNHACCKDRLESIRHQINTNFSQIDAGALKIPYTYRIDVHAGELLHSSDETVDLDDFWDPEPSFTTNTYSNLANRFPDFLEYLSDFSIGSGLHDCYVMYIADEFQEALEENIHRLPAAPEVIISLPKMTVEEVMRGESGEATCMICLEKVPYDTNVTLLPCHHWFHSDEIETWLRQSGTCPYCRERVEFARED